VLKIFSREKWIAVAAMIDGFIIESGRSERAILQKSIERYSHS
jgi:hypothetical protein